MDSFNFYNNGSAKTIQSATGLTIEAFGSLNNWNASGRDSIHAVEKSTAGAGDWAVMLFGEGGSYAAYNSASQGNQGSDAIGFKVLRGNGTALSSYTYQPASWLNTPTNPFTSGSSLIHAMVAVTWA